MPGYRQEPDGSGAIAPLVVSQRTMSPTSSPTESEAGDAASPRIVLEIPPAADAGGPRGKLFPRPRLKAAERAALAIDGVSICFCVCVMGFGVAAAVRDL